MLSSVSAVLVRGVLAQASNIAQSGSATALKHQWPSMRHSGTAAWESLLVPYLKYRPLARVFPTTLEVLIQAELISGGRIFFLGSFTPAPGARCVCASDLPRPTESDPSRAARRPRASSGRCPSRPSVSADSLPPVASTRPSVCPGRCGTCAPCGRRRRPRIVARLRRARSGPSGTPCTSCAACRSWRSARTPRRAASCRTTRSDNHSRCCHWCRAPSLRA